MKNKSISVWLVMKDGDNKGKIVLQKRSLKNKTFPYICQATWAGKVEVGENIKNAIKRECKEELGKEFYEKFNFSELILKSRNTYIMNEQEWKQIILLGI